MARMTIQSTGSEPETIYRLKPAEVYEHLSRERARFFNTHPISSQHAPAVTNANGIHQQVQRYSAPNGDALTITIESGEGL